MNLISKYIYIYIFSAMHVGLKTRGDRAFEAVAELWNAFKRQLKTYLGSQAFVWPSTYQVYILIIYCVLLSSVCIIILMFVALVATSCLTMSSCILYHALVKIFVCEKRYTKICYFTLHILHTTLYLHFMTAKISNLYLLTLETSSCLPTHLQHQHILYTCHTLSTLCRLITPPLEHMTWL